MKEFTTAVEQAEKSEDDDNVIEFAIDGTMCKAYKPKDGQLAVLMASTGRHSSQQEMIAGIINFFVAVLDEDSHSYVVSRLLDRRDAFGIEQVQNIMQWLIGEWSGRPTKSPSGSTTSQQTDGPNSTQSTPALI